MVDEPEIVKELRDEERLGKLQGQSQSSFGELEMSEEVLEDMSDESISVMNDAENEEFVLESTRCDNFASDESLDEKELLFQGTTDLMLYLDRFGRIVKINKAGLAFSGFAKEEVVGKMFWKVSGAFSKRDIPKYIRVFKNALKGKETPSFTGKLNDKSGKKHSMNFSTFPVMENQKLKCVLVIAKDITRQKETEERLHETGERCRLITENTSDLITTSTFTLNPIFTYISPSHKKAIGYESCDLIGKPLLTLFILMIKRI